MKSLLVCCKKNLGKFIAINLILANIFSGCRRADPFCNQEQREKVTTFFEELLLEHGGAYTLFGSKPMTEEVLIDEEVMHRLQQYLQEHPNTEAVFIDRKLEEGWEEYKKLFSHFVLDNYILTEMDYPESKTLVFVNVKNTIVAMRENYDLFKEVIGSEFDPESLIIELRSGEKSNWRRILSDYMLLGILFGYGKENASFFQKKVETGNFDEGMSSEINDPRVEAECYLNGKPFRIPIFVVSDDMEGKSVVSHYKKERQRIKKLYQGKDFLDVTLKQLR